MKEKKHLGSWLWRKWLDWLGSISEDKLPMVSVVILFIVLMLGICSSGGGYLSNDKEDYCFSGNCFYLLGDPSEESNGDTPSQESSTADSPTATDPEQPRVDDTGNGDSAEDPPADARDDGESADDPPATESLGNSVLSDTSAAINPGADPQPSSPVTLASTGAAEVETPEELTGEPPLSLPVCDDGNPRTVDLRDPNGFSCTYLPIDCDDGDPETNDYYDPNLQRCVSQQQPGSQPEGTAGPQPDCDDGNPDTVEEYVPGVGCVSEDVAHPPADEPPADEPPDNEPPADEPPEDEPPADEPQPSGQTFTEDFSLDDDPTIGGASDGFTHVFSDAGHQFVDQDTTPLSEKYPSDPHALQLLTATDVVTFPGQSVDHISVSYSTEFTAGARVVVNGATDTETFDLAHADGWNTIEADLTDIGDNSIAIGEILALELSGAEAFFDDIVIQVP
jgi:hypothetical protein